jgi:Domain of unknown function (DUF2017)
MSTGFVRTTDGGVRIRVETGEAQVIRTLFGQLLDILGEPAQPKTYEGMPELALSDNTSVSDDPVVARLFPDAYGDDEEASAEFRRYTEASLRESKRAAAEVVLRTLGEGGQIVLDADQAQAWLRALNDLRLALGTRLDITEDTFADLGRFDWSDPRNAGYAAYDWLTTLQESLVHAVW